MEFRKSEIMYQGMTEEWKDIENWDGFYSVSTLGRVRSNDRIVNGKHGDAKKKGKILKPAISTIPRGFQYASVMLIKNTVKKRHAPIHVLVAQCFIDNPENKATVNHIDGNKLNNIVTNLEWATMSEQQQHAFRTGLRQDVGEKNSLSKLKESDVKTIRLLFDEKKKTIQELAAEFKTAKSNIQYIVNRQTWKYI